MQREVVAGRASAQQLRAANLVQRGGDRCANGARAHDGNGDICCGTHELDSFVARAAKMSSDFKTEEAYLKAEMSSGTLKPCTLKGG
ncbi:hypothetical protein G6F57_023674 [Rhizopus arrhizus]|nr:hypothetical protein G6F57_023674 [Rhizopus arrhizus]